MQTIAIYGNFVIDNIFETDTTDIDAHAIQCSNYEQRLGGIVNVGRALIDNGGYQVICCGAVNIHDYQRIHDQLTYLNIIGKLQAVDSKTSTASICVFRKTSNKQSMVAWGACREWQTESQNAAWHHIAYLDAMPTIDENFIFNCRRTGPVSVDLCIGKYSSEDITRLKKLVTRVDYVFMSDHEAEAFFRGGTPHNIAIKYTIIHSSHGSRVYGNDDIVYSTDSSFVESLNVLGAGDMFAGNCILNLLSGQSIDKAVIHAHSKTTKTLI